MSHLRSSRLRRQAGDGSSASVVAVFAMVVIVLILLFAWFGFFGGGHWFANNGGSGAGITIQASP